MPEIALTQPGSSFRHSFENPDKQDGKPDGFEVHRHDGIQHLACYIGEQAHKGDNQDGAGEDLVIF